MHNLTCRLTDDSFINLLNKIRINDISYAEIATLNKRYIEDFKPNKGNFYIKRHIDLEIFKNVFFIIFS